MTQGRGFKADKVQRRSVCDRYQDGQEQAPQADENLQPAIPLPRTRTAADDAIKRPRADRHSAHDSGDDGQHCAHLVPQPGCEHLRPDHLVAQPGAAREKEERVEQEGHHPWPHHAHERVHRRANPDGKAPNSKPQSPQNDQNNFGGVLAG